MPEWSNPERGYYVTKYKGKTLEIVRNSDPTEKRRYVAKVDGMAWPNPCHTRPQCKTKAMKWADNPGLYSPESPEGTDPGCEIDVMSPDELTGGEYGPVTNGAIVPYVDPALPTVVSARTVFHIFGSISADTDKFSENITHIKAMVDMLREVGADVECTVEPPPKVEL